MANPACRSVARVVFPPDGHHTSLVADLLDERFPVCHARYQKDVYSRLTFIKINNFYCFVRTFLGEIDFFLNCGNVVVEATVVAGTVSCRCLGSCRGTVSADITH